MTGLGRRIARLERKANTAKRLITMDWYEGRETHEEAELRNFGPDGPPPHDILVVIRRFKSEPMPE